MLLLPHLTTLLNHATPTITELPEQPQCTELREGMEEIYSSYKSLLKEFIGKSNCYILAVKYVTSFKPKF